MNRRPSCTAPLRVTLDYNTFPQSTRRNLNKFHLKSCILSGSEHCYHVNTQLRGNERPRPPSVCWAVTFDTFTRENISIILTQIYENNHLFFFFYSSTFCLHLVPNFLFQKSPNDGVELYHKERVQLEYRRALRWCMALFTNTFWLLQLKEGRDAYNLFLILPFQGNQGVTTS